MARLGGIPSNRDENIFSIYRLRLWCWKFGFAFWLLVAESAAIKKTAVAQM